MFKLSLKRAHKRMKKINENINIITKPLYHQVLYSESKMRYELLFYDLPNQKHVIQQNSRKH